MQQQIQEMQDKYARLQMLQEQLEQSLKVWQEMVELYQQLEAFYQHPEWIRLHDNADQFFIETNGHYSVLSQDALWNVLSEQRERVAQIADMIKPMLANE